MTPAPDAALSNDRRGALYGLLAAALFGLSAPVAKRLLGQVSPQLLAGLLYLGAGIGLSVWRRVRPAKEETPLKRQDAPALAGVVVPVLHLAAANQWFRSRARRFADASDCLSSPSILTHQRDSCHARFTSPVSMHKVVAWTLSCTGLSGPVSSCCSQTRFSSRPSSPS